jgi:hypothetical protein
MQTESEARDRLALPAAGLLFLLGCLVRGAHIFPSAATAGRFAEWSTRNAYAAGYFILIGAVSLSVFGYVALERRLGGRLARIASVLSVVGMQFLLVLFGAALILSPAAGAAHLAGDGAAIALAAGALERSAAVGVELLIALNIVGHGLFAVAIWRSGAFSKAAIVPFVLAPVMLCLPFYYPVELLGGVMFLLAGVLLIGRAEPARVAGRLAAQTASEGSKA